MGGGDEMNLKSEITTETGILLSLWFILWVVVLWFVIVRPVHKLAKAAEEDRKASERYMAEAMTARVLAVSAQEEKERLARANTSFERLAKIEKGK
jgi:hypothetical protein